MKSEFFEFLKEVVSSVQFSSIPLCSFISIESIFVNYFLKEITIGPINVIKSFVVWKVSL